MYTSNLHTTDRTARIFREAIQKAFSEGGRVYAVEAISGEIVPATGGGLSQSVFVFDCLTPVNHPGNYPVIWDKRREDEYVRSNAAALDLVTCITSAVA